MFAHDQPILVNAMAKCHFLIEAQSRAIADRYEEVWCILATGCRVSGWGRGCLGCRFLGRLICKASLQLQDLGSCQSQQSCCSQITKCVLAANRFFKPAERLHISIDHRGNKLTATNIFLTFSTSSFVAVWPNRPITGQTSCLICHTTPQKSAAQRGQF